jgi:DNA mismatch endonuclease (patch repair protein)
MAIVKVSRIQVRGPMSREIVRRVMQANRSTGTGPEKVLASLLRRSKIRFARHVSALPGKPDFVIRLTNVAVFVDGHFWHGYKFSQWKSQLSEYWLTKIQRNRDRDRRTFATLRRRGWQVIRVWEHQLLHPEKVLQRIRNAMDEISASRAQMPLIETNPLLRNPAKSRNALVTNVSSSTSVETGRRIKTRKGAGHRADQRLRRPTGRR